MRALISTLVALLLALAAVRGVPSAALGFTSVLLFARNESSRVLGAAELGLGGGPTGSVLATSWLTLLRARDGVMCSAGIFGAGPRFLTRPENLVCATTGGCEL